MVAYLLLQDNGLGIFVWLHAISYLPVCCGAADVSDETIAYGTNLHHIGRTVSASTGLVFSHDYIHHRVWLQSVAGKESAKVDLERFIEYEYKQGIAAFIPAFHNKGFENSLLLHRHRLVKSSTSNVTFHRSAYGPEDCVNDVNSFTAWVKSLSNTHPARSYFSTSAVSPGDPVLLTLQNDTLNPREFRICTEYAKFVRQQVI